MIVASDLAKLIDECGSLDAVAAKLNEGWEYSAQEFKTETLGGTVRRYWSEFDARDTYEEAFKLLQRPRVGVKYRIVLRKRVFEAEGKVTLL